MIGWGGRGWGMGMEIREIRLGCEDIYIRKKKVS